MTDRDLQVVIGALLHDIGKVIYRDGTDGRTHSESGYDFLKNEIKIKDMEILNCVRFHHGRALSGARIDDNSLAYVVYIADNIASSVDRREKMEEWKGFELHTPLQPVFNLLNKNNGKAYYSPSHINVEKDINYPTDEKKCFTKEQYRNIAYNLSDNLKGIELSVEYVNSLLEVMEANLSFVPSSTSAAEVPDISLFDHLKLTAAIANAIVKYLDLEKNISFKEACLKNEKAFMEKNAFLIASLDISGIQKFIYTIQSKNALRTLRARSFYLEITMEHIIDELLIELGLSRCNLLYAGGGHCYLILPNTDECRNIFEKYLEETNKWFLENFQTDLYIAGGFSACSAFNLKNHPHGSYEQIFRNVSKSISNRKMNRYNAKTIRMLNSQIHDDYTRECSVCKRVAHTDQDGLCSTCNALQKFSAKVLYSDFYTVEYGEMESGLPLPGGYSLIVDTEDSLKKRMQNDPNYVRTYSKNKSFTGKHVATKLWIGNYTTKATFEEFAESSKGIQRVGILRADVDNLGHAFVSGFKNTENNDKYMTISRTATLSRQLSLFFKLHINKILQNPSFSFEGKPKDHRNITIVYSGGDDVFVVGAWNEIIEFAIDLRDGFEKFSEGTLSLSAGIGLYDDTYPISVSAIEVEDMVDYSKDLPNKNAVTLLEDGCFHDKISDGTYKWNEFKEKVIGEKLTEITMYLVSVENQHGNALLYRILELVRKQDEPINFARFVYTLTRLEPEKNGDKTDGEQKEMFRRFSKNMLQWINNEIDRRELKTAIELYVYLHRGEEEN
ncbi:MAG: type III-A CRISPR-associated protein Cas10/Csm1 [[Clostridium] aminophilum]|uniref:type III-A CRISPR-associated protein Cas10/Csm1 n=1 Tax=[Clostridium] aminophilum TaxID=1526 RepID=UPI0026EE74C7|nr:type III-A CRISPR-associated protein Cas10/Csm1 [[Clostridium] aminophilum]MDD6196596.1 type III-A CRISPR-associated protein Cas10/Csm1 [[Clostridium] aminophilum]